MLGQAHCILGRTGHVAGTGFVRTADLPDDDDDSEARTQTKSMHTRTTCTRRYESTSRLKLKIIQNMGPVPAGRPMTRT